MTTRKKLIEVALPLEAINAASAREKSIRHGHPSTLHLWWARRPLAACRAVIFASLVDDPNDPDAPADFIKACKHLPIGKNAAVSDTPRQRLFDFIERLVTWEATTDQAILEQARELIRLSTDGNPPPLLDPFAGGGSIPLEAQRLGLEAHASDLNPVAVMINKALIEIPPRFADRPPVNPRDREEQMGGTWQGAQGLAADVRYYGEWMRDRAWERIGHLYPPGPNGETVIAWIWARTVKCPNPACGAMMPLTKSFEVSKKRGRKAWVEPQVNSVTKAIRFVMHYGKRTGSERTIDRRGATCIACSAPVQFDHIRSEGQMQHLGAQLMAIVTEGTSSRNYYAPTPEHEQIARVQVHDDVPNTNLPEQALGFRVQNYGMTTHRSLFSPRQLLALTTFSDLVSETNEHIRLEAVKAGFADDGTSMANGGTGAQAYADAISIYLTFAINKATNYWSTLCAWYASKEIMMSTFGRQALSMTWDYAEANPFSSSSGNFSLGIEQSAKSLEKSPLNVKQGSVEQQDAATISNGTKFMFSTDPPYYDNIGYADLSDFFYIWLRRTIGKLYPKLFATMLSPKGPELIAEPARHKSKEEASHFFEHGLFQVFARIRDVTLTDHPTSIFYAFKQSEVVAENEASSTGWETFLNGLIQAGFQILGTWPIRTEQSGGLRIVGRNSLASSVVLVCRPRPADAPMTSRQDFVRELREALPDALEDLQSGNIAPVDMAQASIGPGMAVYSRYSKVLEPNGERLSVRTALQLINQELDAYLAQQEGHIDADTRFAVDWFKQFGFEEGEFGVADVLARAKNTSVSGLVEAGIAVSGSGRVRLMHYSELDAGTWNPATDKRVTVWETAHYLIERLDTHGETGAAKLLSAVPGELAADARALVYRLYSICERKGWAEHARDYNALVVSWPQIQEYANQMRDASAGEQISMFEE